MEDKIYKIEALSIFKMTYYIKAKNQSDAIDEYYCEREKDTFKEGGQKHLDEIHSDVVELSEEDFIKDFDKTNDYLRSWSEEQKFNMINEIDYEK